jgi:hypothetical protein
MSSPSLADAGARRSRRRWGRATAWLLGIAITLVTSLGGAVLLLARRGAEPFVWKPPPTPAPGASVPGDFQVTVTPSLAAVDAPVHISIRELPPGDEVLVQAATEDARNVTFDSWARFRADASGGLDLATTAPEDGTYRSIDGNGLLCSMRTADLSAFVPPATGPNAPTGSGWSATLDPVSSASSAATPTPRCSATGPVGNGGRGC